MAGSDIHQGVDLFLSYHRPDAAHVAAIRGFLHSNGLRTFFDSNDIATGLPWPQELERALTSTLAVAVFLGPHGIGNWQRREIWFALDRQAQAESSKQGFPVVPVLLPGAELIPAFLFMNTWVDLRSDPNDGDALRRLVDLVRRGERPDERDSSDLPCPFRGLNSFREEDAGLFFGREAVTRQLHAAVRGASTVLLVGPSGAGKSSVIHAGLLPLLRKQRPPEDSWDTLAFTPGDAPYQRFAAAAIPLLEPNLDVVQRMVQTRSLGDALAKGQLALEDVIQQLLVQSGGSDRLLVIVDQFEELFTLNEPHVARQFIEQWLRATSKTKACGLLSLRADFYGRALECSRVLADAMNQAVINVGPMTAEELRSVVTGPAAKTKLTFEPGLVESILADVSREPGGLPLLEFALTELWTRRQGQLLSHAAYHDLGGVARAIAKRAEAEYQRFDDDDRRRVQRVFTRLVRVAAPEEGGQDTRRRATLQELAADREEDVARVARRLVDSRLVVASYDAVTGEQCFEVAHEALIREWARLRLWLDQDREFHVWRQQLRFRLSEWKLRREDDDELLRGGALDDAVQWLLVRAAELSLEERRYIDQSVRWRQSDAERAAAMMRATQQERDFVLARDVHQKLISSKAPRLDGWEFADLCEAAGSVGGDYFDYVPLPNGRIAVVIADVSGHGLGPSLVMVGLRAFLRAIAKQQSDVGQLTKLMDEFLTTDMGVDRFATMVLASIDPSAGHLDYCGAGEALAIVRHSGKVDILEATGLPIGLMPEEPRPASECCPLAPGDLLVLLTDGVYDAQDPQGNLLSREKVLEEIVRSRDLNAAEIVQQVRRLVADWRGGSPPTDDETLVIVKRIGTAGESGNARSDSD